MVNSTDFISFQKHIWIKRIFYVCFLFDFNKNLTIKIFQYTLQIFMKKNGNLVIVTSYLVKNMFNKYLKINSNKNIFSMWIMFSMFVLSRLNFLFAVIYNHADSQNIYIETGHWIWIGKLKMPIM